MLSISRPLGLTFHWRQQILEMLSDRLSQTADVIENTSLVYEDANCQTHHRKPT